MFVYDCEKYDPKIIARMIAPHILAQEGQKVVIKPNWVMHPLGTLDEWTAVTTNSALVEAVLMNLCRVMNGRGEILICDSPAFDADLNKIFKLNHILEIAAKYQTDSFRIRVLDLRVFRYKTVKNWWVALKPLPGDPSGSCEVILQEESMFFGKKRQEFEVYGDLHKATQAHLDEKHRYSIARSILDCDVFINLPKLKTHRKAGMTCAMKNLVGTVANKFCIPHRTTGTISQGGDDPDNAANAGRTDSLFTKLAQKVNRTVNPWIRYPLLPVYLVYVKLFHQPLSSRCGYDGCWHKNDTIWRAVDDLNRILLYCDKNGVLQQNIQREYICVVDAIIAGEGEGPMVPTPKRCNRLLVGTHPVSVDMVASTLAGFNWKKIHYLRESFVDNKRKALAHFSPNDLSVFYHEKLFPLVSQEARTLRVSPPFTPPLGWKDFIEAK